MIREVTSIMSIPKIIHFASKLYGKTTDHYKKMLINALSIDTSKIIIFEKDNEIRGFIFSTIEEFDGEDVAFIHSCYIDPQFPRAGKQMLSMVREWAAKIGVKNIIMITPRNPKAFIRKYRFEFVSYVLKKGV